MALPKLLLAALFLAVACAGAAEEGASDLQLLLRSFFAEVVRLPVFHAALRAAKAALSRVIDERRGFTCNGGGCGDGGSGAAALVRQDDVEDLMTIVLFGYRGAFLSTLALQADAVVGEWQQGQLLQNLMQYRIAASLQSEGASTQDQVLGDILVAEEVLARAVRALPADTALEPANFAEVLGNLEDLHARIRAAQREAAGRGGIVEAAEPSSADALADALRDWPAFLPNPVADGLAALRGMDVAGLADAELSPVEVSLLEASRHLVEAPWRPFLPGRSGPGFDNTTEQLIAHVVEDAFGDLCKDAMLRTCATMGVKKDACHRPSLQKNCALTCGQCSRVREVPGGRCVDVDVIKCPQLVARAEDPERECQPGAPLASRCGASCAVCGGPKPWSDHAAPPAEEGEL